MIKILLIATISVAVFIILADLIYGVTYFSDKAVKYGVSFSPRYARYLGLDWKKIYIQMLDDLKVKNLRLPSYWTSLEPLEGKYDFSETDFMLSEAEKRGVKVVLVVGLRQPRWPECHMPDWAKDLSVSKRQEKVLGFVQKVVEKYKQNKSIWAYQVENEPFVSWFGENCDKPDPIFLQKEIKLVKDLDKKPVIVTDSGEWSLWRESMQSSDILGISLYRKSFNPYLGYTTYPIPSFFYPLKSNIVRSVFARENKKTIVSELQAEPWVQKAVLDTSIEEQAQLFSIKDFQNNIEFAKKTGFDEAYLWGVEWWYWMAQKGNSQYLDYAKNLF